MEGLIPNEELAAVFETLERSGGLLTHRQCADGTLSPYEANISLFDAFKETLDGADQWQTQRFLCSQAMMLALAGVPAIYYNSFLSTPNYSEGVEMTGRNRTINRRKWTIDEVNSRLDDPSEPAHHVFEALASMIKVRRSTKAFSPFAPQKCLKIHPSLFSIVRYDPSGLVRVVCCFNVSGDTIDVELSTFGVSKGDGARFLLPANGEIAPVYSMQPYSFFWLQVDAITT